MGRPPGYARWSIDKMTTGFSIRPYCEGDFQAVCDLWQACNLTRPWNDPAQDIDFCVQSPASAMFVGIADKDPVATVMTGYDGHRGAIYYLAVHPDQQGMDLGRKMIRYAEDWQKERGVWKVNLMIRDDNNQARDFYRAIGYKSDPVAVMSRRLDQD